MDFNAIWAQVEPYVTWFLSTGVGGFLTYFLARLLARKWFKANDVDNFISNVVTGLTGKTLDIDFTAYTERQLGEMQKALQATFEERQKDMEKKTQEMIAVMKDLSGIYLRSKLITDEDRAKLQAHVDELPEEYLAMMELRGEKKERVVCDYIAGMTDKYAIYTYSEIFIPTAWQVR